ncbi:sigma factor-like helix-turn-helix DNA-binding protein [Streptomyces uncialis]|uniref:sigma factor-like helix-turn-helix DNA-binding protein n=1 Tax=Streptomyces uncialis TaxID=1048205 RepID=UPI003825E4DD
MPSSDPGSAPARPGRKLGPIADCVGSSHRALLEPLREQYLASGRTLSDLSLRVLLAKSKLSELLRGVGLYPRWETVYRLAAELDLPARPLLRLWKQAAHDAQKSPDWIARSKAKAPLTGHQHPPLDYRAFKQMAEDDYRCYAAAFLPGDQRDSVVAAAFSTLWLSWPEALASPDTARYAWTTLRTAVMARTPHLDGRPELGPAAFNTAALHGRTTDTGRMAQLAESLELFRAISRLPAAQLDVIVLRRLCGATDEDAAALLGVPLAAVRSDERHATRYLESVICPPPDTGGTTA